MEYNNAPQWPVGKNTTSYCCTGSFFQFLISQFLFHCMQRLYLPLHAKIIFMGQNFIIVWLNFVCIIFYYRGTLTEHMPVKKTHFISSHLCLQGRLTYHKLSVSLLDFLMFKMETFVTKGKRGSITSKLHWWTLSICTKNMPRGKSSTVRCTMSEHSHNIFYLQYIHSVFITITGTSGTRTDQTSETM